MAREQKKNKRLDRPATKGGQHPSAKEAVVIEQVKNIAEPICETEGIELVHVEYQRESSGRILRLYIDKPEGVMLDDCVRINRHLGDLLDVYLENIGPYHLEISSPGQDRPIGKTDDYERFKGCEAKIKTMQSIEGQRNFRGVLMGVSEDTVGLMIDEKAVAIPLKEIQKARLINYNGENPCSSQT